MTADLQKGLPGPSWKLAEEQGTYWEQQGDPANVQQNVYVTVHMTWK